MSQASFSCQPLCLTRRIEDFPIGNRTLSEHQRAAIGTTLATGSWGLLESVPAGLERTVTITDTNASDPERFYRASVAP